MSDYRCRQETAIRDSSTQAKRIPPKRVSQSKIMLKPADLFFVPRIRELSAKCFTGLFVNTTECFNSGSDHHNALILIVFRVKKGGFRGLIGVFAFKITDQVNRTHIRIARCLSVAFWAKKCRINVRLPMIFQFFRNEFKELFWSD